ncbi:helix-turn-helix transcriptional regulator [Kitasatospora sp. NPDC004240]
MVLPVLPALDADDLQLVRLVLTPGPFKARARAVGIPMARINGAPGRVCDLLGATHLPQAGAIAAAYCLFTSADLGLPELRGPLHLAPRKRAAMELLISGLEDFQIAEQLQLSSDTVRGYLTDAVTDLACPRRPQAAFTAIASGTLSLSAISPLYPDVRLPLGSVR